MLVRLCRVADIDDLTALRGIANVSDPDAEIDAQIDPDPFTIGLGIFGAIAGGGAFLENRRQRQLVQDQQRGAFRAAWFAARRTLLFFKHQIDEFETYMLEDGAAAARWGKTAL